MDANIKAALDDFQKNVAGQLQKHDQAITELAQNREVLGNQPAQIKSFAADAVKQIAENADQLQKHGSLRLELKAAGDIITTAQVGNTQNIGLMGPTPMPLGIQNAMPARLAIGASSIEYSRFEGTEGDADVQAAEGDAKAAVRGDWLLVNQPSVTIAGHSLVSRQAIADSAQLQGAINSVMQRSIAKAVDALIWTGEVGLFAGFSTLASTHTSTTFTALPDAVSEGVSAMQAAGFNPTSVVVNPTTWVAIVTARGTSNDAYLSGNYLGSQEMMLRGLPVVLSVSVPANKAVLIDSLAAETVVTAAPVLEIGFVNDGFIRNQATLLMETRVAPVLKALDGVMVVTPKAVV